MKQKKQDQAPLTIGGQKLPAWTLLLLLLVLWPIWVVTYGPYPTPRWMLHIIAAVTLVPLALLAIYILLQFLRAKSATEVFMSEQGFQLFTDEEMEPRSQLLTEGGAVNPMFLWSLKGIYRGVYRDVLCELYFFEQLVNNGKQHCTLCGVPVAPAPDLVHIKRSVFGVHRLYIPNQRRIGSKRFNRKWNANGDIEAAQYMITEQFEQQLQLSDKVRFPIIFWLEDRFYYGFIGRPTDAGVEFMLTQAIELTRAASILADPQVEYTS